MILMAITALLMCSCIFEDMSDCPNYVEGAGEPIDVEFCVSSSDSSQTKSSVSFAENAVKNLAVCIYHNGMLVKEEYYTSPSTFSISLVKGLKYNIYAIANHGRLSGVGTEEDMIALRLACEKITKIQTGFPMSWKRLDYLAGKDSDKVTISLERLVSKINLTVDTSELEDFTINSVRLYQCALTVYPFHQNGDGGSRAESVNYVDEGDYASTSDLDKLNAGESITFYAMENCQGVLLEGNKSADVKVPEEIPSSANLCTYLELTASHSGEIEGVALSSDHVTYRFYIGNDNCTDFNIRRNTNVNIHLKVTKDRIFDKGWKVDYGVDVPEITTDLTLSSTSLTVYKGARMKLNAIKRTLKDGQAVNGTDVSTECTWTSSDDSIATVEKNGVVLGEKIGSAVITCKYEDFTLKANVTVKNASTYKVEITPATVTLATGESKTLEATYNVSDGSYAYWENIAKTATWTSSNTSVATVSEGKITAVGKGTATITATFKGTKGSMTVTVSGNTTYDYTLTPTTMTLVAGRSSKMTIVKRTFTDGTQTNGQDVSSTFTWTSSNTSIASVNASGVITGVAPGTATITAKGDGYTLKGTVTVTDNLTYELAISPNALTINKGTNGTLTAIYKTFRNGTLESSVNVTSSASWSSSNTSIAGVSQGHVAGVATGNANITATYNGLSATVVVIVKGSSALTLGWTSQTVQRGKVISNAAIYNPNDGTAAKVVTSTATWTTSNPAVATVNGGTISAQGNGTAVITATYNGLSASCAITVTGDLSNPPNAYVSTMSTSVVNIGGNQYKLMLSLRFSDGTVIDDVPYRWGVNYAQSPDIPTSTTGDGPLIYAGGGTTYTLAVALTTTGYYKDSSGNNRTWTTGTSISHNVSWTP